MEVRSAQTKASGVLKDFEQVPASTPEERRRVPLYAVTHTLHLNRNRKNVIAQFSTAAINKYHMHKK